MKNFSGILQNQAKRKDVKSQFYGENNSDKFTGNTTSPIGSTLNLYSLPEISKKNKLSDEQILNKYATYEVIDNALKTNPKITDLSIQSEGYGAYSVSGTLTPDKDYDYLEMVVVFYDDSGAVIDKSPLVWNMNDIQKDQIVKINGNAYVNGDSTPSKAEVYILDSAFGGNDLSDAIYNQTITI